MKKKIIFIIVLFTAILVVSALYYFPKAKNKQSIYIINKLKMPVLFKQNREINLYYYNPRLDQDEFGNIACSQNGLVVVKRTIPFSKTPIQDTIKLLLLGELTEKERAQGISTEYPLEGFSLKSASLKNKILTLEFDDPKNKTIGGSCRVRILWLQIEATAKQFPEVRQVRFLPEKIFQP